MCLQHHIRFFFIIFPTFFLLLKWREKSNKKYITKFNPFFTQNIIIALREGSRKGSVDRNITRSMMDLLSQAVSRDQLSSDWTICLHNLTDIIQLDPFRWRQQSIGEARKLQLESAFKTVDTASPSLSFIGIEFGEFFFQLSRIRIVAPTTGWITIKGVKIVP